jgi:hypothetical protein
MNCSYVGSLSESKGVIWQYSAIDVASTCTRSNPQHRIKARRSSSNGCFERRQLSILEESWRAARAHSRRGSQR